MSDLAKWVEEHKDEISSFLPVEEPGWTDQCKYYSLVRSEGARLDTMETASTAPNSE